MKTLFKISIVILAMALFGCSGFTKSYGRQERLTEYEKEYLTCREIGIEIARAKEFVRRVHDESTTFDSRDTSAMLADLGQSNVVEKDLALKSAVNRIKSLNELMKKKGCQVDEIVKK